MTYLTSRYLASKRLLRLLLACAALLILLLSGCGRSATRRTLLHAESIMEEHPDSAYALLSALSVDSAAPEEDRALHALLMTQAMDKTGRMTRDSLSRPYSMITFAERYFSNHFDKERLMKSLFYKGVNISMRQERFTESLLPLYESLEYANEMDDPFWLGKIYQAMGDVFGTAKAYRDQCEMYRKSLQYFRQSKREEFIKYSEYELSNAYFNSENYKSAIELAQNLKKSMREDKDSILRTACGIVLAKSYMQLGKPDLSVQEIKELDTLGYHQADMDVFHIVSLVNLGENLKARELYDRCLPEMDEDDRMIAQFALSENDIAARMSILMDLYKSEVAEKESITSLDLNSVQAEAMRVSADKHNHHRNKIIHTSLFIIIVLALIISIISFYYHKRGKKLRAKKREIENLSHQYTEARKDYEEVQKNYDVIRKDYEETRKNYSEIQKDYEEVQKNYDVIKKDYEEAQKNYDEIQKEYEKILKDKKQGDALIRMLREKMKEIETLNGKNLNENVDFLDKVILYEITYGDKDKKEDNKTLRKIREEINRYRIGSKDLKKLERTINRKANNIMANLRRDMPELKEEEYALALYMLIGLNTISIGYLCGGKEAGSVSNDISRLRNKIRNRFKDNIDCYALFLTKKDRSDILGSFPAQERD